jgi:cytochrome c556
VPAQALRPRVRAAQGLRPWSAERRTTRGTSLAWTGAMTLRRRHLVLATGVIVGVLVLIWARPLERSHRLAAPERLPESARAAVRTQMHAHARGMMALVSTVTVLDYDAAAASAGELLAEPRLARPIAGDAAELNGALPARFFGLQDELRTQLAEVQQAARARDPEALANAFAAAARTCVQCHATYLRGR